MAARAVTRAYDEALRPAGMRVTQFAVLVAVADGGAMSVTALAEILGMDRSTLTRNLVPLEQAGLVQIGSEGWRRSREIALTRKGAIRLDEATPLWEAAQHRLKRQLGGDQWSSVHRTLDLLATAT
jgi:DNA-binding MarR family transcriptional regulator